MMAALLHDRLAQLLHALEGCSDEARQDLIYLEVTETGGHWDIPPADSPALVEIQLHGLTAAGLTLRSAIDAWIAKARSTRPPLVQKGR